MLIFKKFAPTYVIVKVQNKEEGGEKRLLKIVLVDEDTHEQLRSLRYRTWYPLGLVFLLIGLIALTSTALLFLPPFQTILGKLTQTTDSAELLKLREQTLSLEELADAQNLMIGNLQKMINGEIMGSEDSSDLAPQVHNDSIPQIDRIEEDELLRREIEIEERLALASQPLSSEIGRASRPLQQLYLVAPVTGSVSLGFDPAKRHLGVDINAPAGTPIKSILAGHIIYAGWTLETGNTVGIQHDHNLISFYKHNSALLKETGTFVQAGEAVAIIGNTGTLSSGPHLHFELWSEGKPVNPREYIDFE